MKGIHKDTSNIRHRHPGVLYLNRRFGAFACLGGIQVLAKEGGSFISSTTAPNNLQVIRFIRKLSRGKAMPKKNKKRAEAANLITGADSIERSEKQALAEEVEGSLSFYLGDILRKVAEIEEDALESHDEDEP